ncbi:hypothetical protein DpV84gp009 [Deerpox virus W-1170-84]|uniref:Alpha amanitin sensitivity protein n=1 Tax=Deerpox virus (strain W-1170-84) TaxID=305676 RepID=Q08FH1_DPV84|nr:hypothetical protein DpV84gp009 [Deerpox virus W-1170-84]AUI80571.1 hypothetical protein [White-tailed deer poxvirus]
MTGPSSCVIVKNFIKDYRSGRIIRKYLKKLSKDEFKQFCIIFKENADFSRHDKDPTKKEVIKIFEEEFYSCDLRLFYDIIKVIPNKLNIHTIIEKESNDILEKSKYSNKKINYIILDKLENHHSIDDIIYMYFQWRKSNKYGKQVQCGKIFKELLKYDNIAYTYYKDVDHYVSMFTQQKIQYLDIHENFNGDILTHCKATIGLIGLLTSKINFDMDFSSIFFAEVSIRHRLLFKKFFITKLKYN